MTVGVCTIELYLPANRSLKDKRRVLKSLMERIKQRFNVAIAEVEEQDLWQKSVIGITCIGNRKDHVNGMMDKVVGAIRSNPQVEVVQCRMEFF